MNEVRAAPASFFWFAWSAHISCLVATAAVSFGRLRHLVTKLSRAAPLRPLAVAAPSHAACLGLPGGGLAVVGGPGRREGRRGKQQADGEQGRSCGGHGLPPFGRERHAVIGAVAGFKALRPRRPASPQPGDPCHGGFGEGLGLAEGLLGHERVGRGRVGHVGLLQVQGAVGGRRACVAGEDDRRGRPGRHGASSRSASSRSRRTPPPPPPPPGHPPPAAGGAGGVPLSQGPLERRRGHQEVVESVGRARPGPTPPPPLGTVGAPPFPTQPGRVPQLLARERFGLRRTASSSAWPPT